MTEKLKEKGRSTVWGFRKVSILVATALILIIGVATIVPSAVIFASNSTGSLAAIPATNVSNPDIVVSSQEMEIFEPVLVSSQDIASDPGGLLAGGVTPPDEEEVYEPPMLYQGGTCISGYVIDRYHEPAGIGWKVTITHEDGETAETTIDEDGEFEFKNLKEGVWTVELEIPDGWREFTPSSFKVTLKGEDEDNDYYDDDDVCAEVRFKVEALPCLVVKKYDAGGYMGFDELVGIAGWEMTATNGDITLSSITDGKGEATFYDLKPGEWLITEEEKEGWQPAKGYGYQRKINLTSPVDPGVCEEVEFVNEQVYGGCIEVQKVDEDGRPLSGWTMVLTRDDGTQQSVSSVTDSNGFATFKGLTLGAWTVEEHVEDWWRPVDSSVKKVYLDKPGYCEPVVFSNEPLGCVDGYKINHFEQGLENWEITARNEETGEEFTEETDKHGYFKFDELPMGTWIITEKLQPGWEPVTPSELVVDVTDQYECEHVRFKNRTDYACVDIYKMDYTDGAGLAGWEFSIEPKYGGDPLTGETDGTGWLRFNKLVPGDYVITEEIKEGWDPVTPDEVDITLYNTGVCEVVVFENIQEHMKKPPPPPPDDPCTFYKVQDGQSLRQIAEHFGANMQHLLKLNNLSKPKEIYPGMNLLVCYP